MTNIKKIVPVKNREINVDNMQIKFKIGRNIHGKTHSYANQKVTLDSSNPLDENFTRDFSGSTIETNTGSSKIFTHVDQLKNIYGENEGTLPSIANNSIDVSNS
tara:strand:+ start:309 stop:620 length:312 start_codon:yes stop_codon:yes gene_type:complete